MVAARGDNPRQQEKKSNISSQPEGTLEKQKIKYWKENWKARKSLKGENIEQEKIERKINHYKTTWAHNILPATAKRPCRATTTTFFQSTQL